MSGWKPVKKKLFPAPTAEPAVAAVPEQEEEVACPGFQAKTVGVEWAGMACKHCPKKKKAHSGWHAHQKKPVVTPSAQKEQNRGGRWRLAVFGERIEVNQKAVKPTKNDDDPYHPTVMQMRKLKAKTQEETDRILKIVSGHLLFAKMDTDQRVDVANAMWRFVCTDGQVIIKRDWRMDRLFVVNQGVFEVDDGSLLTEGMHVGDEALMTTYFKAVNTITAKGDAEAWVLDRRELRQILINTSNTRHKEFEQFLRSINVFASLSHKERHKLVDALEVKAYDEGQEIIRQGEMGGTFYIIRRGEVDVRVKGDGASGVEGEVTVACYKTGDYFGERSLIKRQVRAATVTAKCRVEVLTLKENVFKLLVGAMDQVFAQRDLTYRSSVQNARKSVVDQQQKSVKAVGFSAKVPESIPEVQEEGNVQALIAAANQMATGGGGSGVGAADAEIGATRDKAAPSISINLGGGAGNRVSVVTHDTGKTTFDHLEFSDLTIIGTLGRGAFGHVQLVTEERSMPGNAVVHACKTVNKKLLVELQQQDHIKSEKDVMAQLDNPFLVKLRRTLNQPHTLHFLMEPCLGGEMKSILMAQETLDVEVARFAAACVVMGFDYLHSKNICFRDLKPENLLLDTKGYCKMTDFGFAKYIGPDGRTWTMCGTPDYLAPEVVSQQGHDCGVDWWTLGILIYEMRVGDPPFWDDNPMGTYQNIMEGDIDFDIEDFTEEDVDIIKSLLSPRSERLGVTKGGVQSIKEHPWFAGFDWDRLANRSLPAPDVLIRPVNDDLDLSNFQDLLGEDERWGDFEPEDEDPFADF